MAARRLSFSINQRPRSLSRKRNLPSRSDTENRKKHFLLNHDVPPDDSSPPILLPTVPPGDPILEDLVPPSIGIENLAKNLAKIGDHTRNEVFKESSENENNDNNGVEADNVNNTVQL